MRKDQNRSTGRILRWGAIVLCLAVFLFSGAMILRTLYRGERERGANETLAEQVRQLRETLPSEAPSSAPSPADSHLEERRQEASGESPWPEAIPEEEKVMLPQYEALWEQNHDLAGWLRIEGTEIDYPVMYTPQDPTYYLRRAFDGSDAISGSLFIDAECSANHILIYGHNMKNGTMFEPLLSYAHEDFARQHSEIYFDTLYEEGTYEVMAAFYSQVSDQQGDEFPYYEYADLAEEARFSEYVGEIKAASLYDSGVQAEYGDQLLTLSTCSYHEEDGRFVVVAKRKD